MKGRPSSYTEKVGDMICERIAEGQSLHRLCMEKDTPEERTVYRWLEQNEDFRQKYMRARERQADRFADEIVHIADEAIDASLGRLRMDARKWHASKTAPKKYGDKVAIGGDPDAPAIQHVHVIERRIVRPTDPDR